MKALHITCMLLLLTHSALFGAFSKDAKGIIHCDSDPVGSSQMVDGVTYTKIGNKNDLIIHSGSVDATQACTSEITDMSSWFANQSDFNKDISHWDTSSVTNMRSMFLFATSFNQTLKNWDTGNVTNMNAMFYNASTFNLSIGNWDTSNVTDMNSMFFNAGSFNQPLGNWKTSNVLYMNYMFYEAVTFNQDLSRWCVKNIATKPLEFDLNTTPGFENNSTKQPQWGDGVCSNMVPVLYLLGF